MIKLSIAFMRFLPLVDDDCAFLFHFPFSIQRLNRQNNSFYSLRPDSDYILRIISY